VHRALSGAFGDFVGLSPYFSGLPYLLDFAASRDEIVAALKKGVVICDRHVSSTVAYHSAKLSGKAAEEYVRFVEDVAYKRLRIPVADLTLYLDVPVKHAQQQMKGKKLDQYERDTKYQERVAKAYRQLGKRKSWKTVTCVEKSTMRTPVEIHEDIVEIVGKLR
jgi:dTMP kinase